MLPSLMKLGRLAGCLFLLIPMACSNVSYNEIETSLKPTRLSQPHQVTVVIGPSRDPDSGRKSMDRSILEKTITERIQRQSKAFVLTKDASKADYILSLYEYTQDAGWYFNEKTGHCTRESGNIDVFPKLLYPWAHTTCEEKLVLRVMNNHCNTYDDVWAVNVQYSYITIWLIPAFPVNWIIHALNPPNKTESLNQLIDGALERIVANQAHYDQCERTGEVQYRDVMWFPSPDRYLPMCDEAGRNHDGCQLRFKPIDKRVGYMEKVGGKNCPCLDQAGQPDTKLPTCAQACPGKTVNYGEYQRIGCSDVPGFRCLMNSFGTDPDRP